MTSSAPGPFRRRTASERRPGRVPWVWLALGWGAVLAVAWTLWESHGLNERVVRDTVVYVLGPGVLAVRYREHLGWRVDRRAVRNAVLLAAFVLPFYVVGSSLPTVREFYPMWGVPDGPGGFLEHAAKQFLVVLAAETYFRGLLCVSVREIGPKAALISPVVYALQHAGKPPIEILLSGPTDVLFGVADYASESLLPSVVAHGLGLILLDWLVLRPPVVPTDAVVRWLSWLPVPL